MQLLEIKHCWFGNTNSLGFDDGFASELVLITLYLQVLYSRVQNTHITNSSGTASLKQSKSDNQIGLKIGSKRLESLGCYVRSEL